MLFRIDEITFLMHNVFRKNKIKSKYLYFFIQNFMISKKYLNKT
jgi:hypothetical protein